MNKAKSSLCSSQLSMHTFDIEDESQCPRCGAEMHYLTTDSMSPHCSECAFDQSMAHKFESKYSFYSCDNPQIGETHVLL